MEILNDKVFLIAMLRSRFQLCHGPGGEIIIVKVGRLNLAIHRISHKVLKTLGHRVLNPLGSKTWSIKTKTVIKESYLRQYFDTSIHHACSHPGLAVELLQLSE